METLTAGRAAFYFQHAGKATGFMGGPGALAARTDPNWDGREDVAQTFV